MENSKRNWEILRDSELDFLFHFWFYPHHDYSDAPVKGPSVRAGPSADEIDITAGQEKRSRSIVEILRRWKIP
jgi:hypothetical protein